MLRFTVAGVVRGRNRGVRRALRRRRVATLTVYFLADMRRTARASTGFCRTLEDARAILIGDEVVAKFGNYLVGNALTSVIAGAATEGGGLLSISPTRCCSA